MQTWFYTLSVVLIGCAQQSVDFPNDSGDSDAAQGADAATEASVEAGPPTRVGTYFGDYVVSSGGGGTMLLIVKADGFATITPKDVNATGTGTVDSAGNITVTTQYDSYAQATLYFTGTLAFDGTSWTASGTVVPQDISNQTGSWSASLK